MNSFRLLICFCSLFFLYCTEVPDYGSLKVNVSPANGGSISQSPSGPEYKDGTVVTLTAMAASGYEFAGWLGNVMVTDATKTTVTIDGDLMVTANFVKIPDAPKNVVAMVSSANSITIEWSSVPNATGYRIYRSTNSSGTYTLIGTSTTNSYIDNTGNLGTTYYYKVTAYNGNVESSQSIYTLATTQLNAPSGLTATVNSANSITIEWSRVSNATGYRIYRSTNSSGTYTLIGTSTTTSYTDTGLSASTTYYYRVSTYNSNGEGSQSNPASATTSTQLSITATAYSDGITIEWSYMPNATEYRIYRRTGSSGNFDLIDVITDDSYIDYPGDTGTYYYRVDVYNYNERISQSNSVSVYWP